MEFNPIKDFWNFINYPVRHTYEQQVPQPFLYVNVLFICAFFINILAMSIVTSLVIDLNDIGNVFDDMDYGFFAMFGIAVIAAPLVEELIFRFPLRNKKALSVLVGFIAAALTAIVCAGQGYPEGAYVAAPAVFLIFMMTLVINKKAWDGWQFKLDHWYPYIFFLVAGIFGFIHIYNYELSAFSWWMAPLIVIPQFVLALFLGFARLRVGFWACIYMHALNNTIPVVLVFLMKDAMVG